MRKRIVPQCLLLIGLVLALGASGDAQRPGPRAFREISFQRPLSPIFADSIEDCVEYRAEWQEILKRIKAESNACAGANAMTAHNTVIPSCSAYFPEVENVGGCRTYRACYAIEEQFWSTLHQIEEESKQCTDHVAMMKMLERKERTKNEEELVRDLVSGALSVRGLIEFIKGLSGPDPAAAIEKKLIDFASGIPGEIAEKSTDAARTVMNNAVDEFVKAMEKAAADNDKAALETKARSEASQAVGKASVPNLGSSASTPIADFTNTSWVCSNSTGPMTAPRFLQSGQIGYIPSATNSRARRVIVGCEDVFDNDIGSRVDPFNSWQQRDGRIRWTCRTLNSLYEGSGSGGQMTVRIAGIRGDEGTDLFSLPLQFTPAYSCSLAK